MELKIYWTEFAKAELQNIFDYYKEKASLNIAKKLVTSISKEVLKLTNHPNIGQHEELLLDRPENFRYFVHKNYKIIYWVNLDKNRVEIVDVFDARQNPEKIKRS